MSEEILNKLDERKLAARRTLIEENPRPEGYSEELIEDLQVGWKEVLDATRGEPDAVDMVIRGALRSGQAPDVWLFQGGDDWLYDSFIARGWNIRQYFTILALNAPNINVRHAALDLDYLIEAYVAAGWKPMDVPVEKV
jgi:hypothetical protein